MRITKGLSLLLSGLGLLWTAPGLAEDQAGGEGTVSAAPCDGAACDGNGCDGCECGCQDGCSWCNLGEPYELFGEVYNGVTIGGWWQFGYTNKSDGVFNTHPNNFNLHQGWLFVEKAADGSEGFDWGVRMDLLYGVDAQNTQAFGNNPGKWDFQNGWDHGIYGWAMPQLYIDLAYKDWTVKAGHFFTPAGYEVVAATGNFFYSHAFTHNFSEPFTHTGVLISYAATEKFTGYAGWTAGWDTGFDQFSGGSNFLGGGTYAVSDDLSASYILTAGDLGVIGDGSTHHFVVDWKFAEKWEYVLSSDIVHTSQPVFTGNGYDTFSLANYLFYSINDCLRAGTRLEWWKADGISYYETTYGLNIRPHANVAIRPEIRYQWSPAGDGPAGNPVGLPLKGAMFGIDAIVTF